MTVLGLLCVVSKDLISPKEERYLTDQSGSRFLLSWGKKTKQNKTNLAYFLAQKEVLRQWSSRPLALTSNTVIHKREISSY